ncbi:MAG: molecular chaperone [Symploca sp. SIO2E9]|nr:molecular chaperone [Symploca sp. SIO2E9]
MPVEFRLLPRLKLRTITKDIGEVLELPIIELVPIKTGNSPYLSKITYSVWGKPRELAGIIKSSYEELDYANPLKLDQPLQLKQKDCVLDQSLPAEINCILQVRVDYFESDAADKPILSEPKKAVKQSHLCYPFLFLDPPDRSQLEEENMISETNNLGANEPMSDQIRPLPPIERTSATEKSHKNPEINYPGWLAIDFGTANSTITLFDPRLSNSHDGLPKEQEFHLQKRLLQEWLSSSASDALPSVSAGEWEKFINDLCKKLHLTDQSQLKNAPLLEAIHQVELSLGNRSEAFRCAASVKLNQIYHEVFRIPPLESQNLIPVELDASTRGIEIPSELEILSPLESPLKVILGNRARQNRKDAFASNSSNSGNEIQGKYHHSPKRYFGVENKSIEVTLDGQKQKIEVNQLIQAAWNHLIDLTEKYRQRNPDRFAEGKFTTAVVTYPTVAPPRVRRDIHTLVEALGIKDIRTAYDEAVSVAIFFLWRSFGGNLNVGIESFKTRCRCAHEQWWQNVLVLDIGGGTTDIALIRLTLEEINPFRPDEDRGYGGRYYKLIPKLLGSTGHLNLGGELITLRIFRLLKVAIADCLLSAVTEGSLKSEKLEDLINQLEPQFLDNGKFQSGKLLSCLDKQNPENYPGYKSALDNAEKVLPTRWEPFPEKQFPERLQTFYTLWDHAENAKLKLGQKSKSKTQTEPTFVLSEPDISELLSQSNIDCQVQDSNSLEVTLNSQQFEQIITPIIKEAIGISKGLMESRLRSEDATNNSKDNSKDNSKEMVDWLILSGKTCNLQQVERELYQEFSKSDCFVWNPERITFVPEYTKLATSAGACYAEKLRRFSFDPQGAKELLIKGANQLYIDVNNLFYFLSCSFKLNTATHEFLTIFDAGQELYRLDPRDDSVAKFRSKWLPPQLLIIIYRQDFDNGPRMLWGSFSCEKLAKDLNMKEEDFKERIRVQFEINQKLEFNLFFCQGKPHYLIEDKVASLDVAEAVSKNLTEPEKQGVIIDNQLKCEIAVKTDTVKTDIVKTDIAVNVLEARTVDSDAYHPVFEVGKDYSNKIRNFRYEDGVSGQEVTGLISKPLPPFPKSNKHTFYFRESQTDNWILIGELSRPEEREANNNDHCQYRVTLDEKGIIRLHTGEVNYWTSDNLEDLQQEGCVVSRELELQSRNEDVQRNPFNGRH